MPVQQCERAFTADTATTTHPRSKDAATMLVSIGNPTHSEQSFPFGHESTALWLQPCAVARARACVCVCVCVDMVEVLARVIDVVTRVTALFVVGFHSGETYNNVLTYQNALVYTAIR